MLKQLITMLVLTFVLLYGSVTFFFVNEFTRNNSNNINLLEYNSQLIYGSLVSNKNGLKFEIDSQGEALVLFNLPIFNTENYSQLKLEINGLSNNYQIRLEWANTNDNKLYSMQLLQPNEDSQLNVLSNNVGWRGNITQTALRIVPQNPLGLSMPTTNNISINTMILANYNYIDNLPTLFSYWFDYDAWSYKSLHHLKNNSVLPIYTHPIIFIVIWLIICIMLNNLIFSSKFNSLYIILSAWGFLSIIHFYNNQAKTNWVQSVYNNEKTRLPDEELWIVAENVKSYFEKQGIDPTAMKNNKLLILSSDRYKSYRLIYHLLPLNSSSISLETQHKTFLKLSNKDYILKYDLADRNLISNNTTLSINGEKIEVNEVLKGSDFSLLQVSR